MTITRRSFVLSTAALALASTPPPRPYGVCPSPQQLAWSELEFYNFLHFTVNTFTDKEWGYGDENPSIFNPTAFDPDRIIETLKNAGSRGVILTCKHHDGFCLWPTKTTEHSVKHSPYKNGKGDIVRELSDAAHRHGLKFGVYLSPWDRNQSSYGSPQYIEIYRRQMRELLTNYGPIFEIWHDGANGGDGFYGGARQKRIIDKLHYYNWPVTWNLERELQPNAAIFSDVGPDVRWVGNENGFAGETCWATYTPHSPNGGPGSPGDVIATESVSGTRDGKYWMPAECDVSIRPGWFFHSAENGRVKTPADLFNLYLKSVGRGGSFLLNIPPDRRGLIYETDAASISSFGKIVRDTFAKNLAASAEVKASNTRGNQPSYAASHLLDGRRETYWSPDDSATTPQVTFDFQQPVAFNLVRLREHLPLGQRISAFSVDTWQNGTWSPFAQGTSIGICRILKSSNVTRTNRVRLRITKSPVCPALSEFGLYLSNT
ncbi:MAG TPA: alpha-L-fucosidase [Bryobacteraceae bacterium]|nr:alpha-L-fucosidase [Bryobacteraceae bacterium]